MIAETYVFIYLGMATFAFPIFQRTGYMLFVVSLMACFVGRLHIYIGSWLTNCFRTKDGTTLPPISNVYMFIMWFSGLRGGVAFALASVSYMANDFPQRCGGLSGEALEAATAAGKCHRSMTDSLAIMQTTLLIAGAPQHLLNPRFALVPPRASASELTTTLLAPGAAFTIFVFGGAITEVAVTCKVLEKKKKAPVKEEPGPPSSWTIFSNKYIRPVLTFDTVAPVESGTRFAEAVEHFAGNPDFRQESNAWAKAKAVQTAVRMNAKEIKMSLSADQLESALKGSGMDVREATLEDQLDELRAKLPAFSATQLKKLLEEAGGDVELAARKAPRPGTGTLEML